MTRDAKRFLICVCGALLLLSGISLVGSLFGLGGPVVGETKTYEVTGEIKILDVEIGAAEFRVLKGDKFSVESNLKNLNFNQKDDKLVLLENSGGNKSYKNAFLTVYIPEGTVFSKIDITTGAGTFTADVLSAEKLNFVLGAGEVNIKELNASAEARINGGAGEITIEGGNLNNLTFEMGVGELELVALISGESKLDIGVGEAKITLLGSREDYTVELTKGIGSILFDGESLSTGKTMGNGKHHVKINGGIGSIEVDFE